MKKEIFIALFSGLLQTVPAQEATISGFVQISEKHSLIELSGTLGIHPVHLSRDFSKQFQCSVGEYIRKLKIEKSLLLLSNKKHSLIDIAFECGFSDQSHFISSFKEITGINPSAYRKLF